MTAGVERLPDQEIRRLADRYRIDLDAVSSAGTFGARAGRETGASVEIQDFRNYVPGDDPRRIDWFSFARTGNLIVRLFREEVSPFFDVIADTSSSMAIEDGHAEDEVARALESNIRKVLRETSGDDCTLVVTAMSECGSSAMKEGSV